MGKAKTKPNLDKVRVVVEFPILHTITNVQAFLGLTGYYMNYIKRYVRITVPLFDLTKCDVTFQWTQKGQKAFDQLKQALVFAPILTIFDFCKGFILDIYWSTKGVGAIFLSQKEGKKECVIVYANKGLFHL